MGNANRRDSIKAVHEQPLAYINDKFDKVSDDSISDLGEELKSKIKLNKENEMKESDEFLLGGKEDEFKNDFIFEKEINLSLDQNNHSFRSKSCACNNNISYFNAPKPKIKKFNEHISPFKLSWKSYGDSQWKKKKPNEIMLDFRKNLFDSKSCNDNQNEDDDLFYENDSDSDTERTTPNREDIKNISNCRKKMAIFRDSINNKSEHSFKEEEKIEDILNDKKNKSNKSNKRNKFWIKHIKQQMLKSKLSNNIRISEGCIKKSETINIRKIKSSSDLFILGILESASKEIKMKKQARYTSNV